MTTQQRINIYSTCYPVLNWLLERWPNQKRAKRLGRRISFLFLSEERRAKGFKAWNDFVESVEG